MADRSRKLLPRQCKRLRPGQSSVDCVVPVVVVENYTRPLTRLAAKTATENPNKATEDSNSEETLSSEAALPFAKNKDDFATNQNFQEEEDRATKNDKKMQQESDTSSNRSTDVSEFGTQLEIPSEIDSEKLHDRAEGETQASTGNALKLAICYEGAIENVVNATKSNERSSTSKVVERGKSSERAERHDALKTEERKAEGNESKDNYESQIQPIEQSLTQTESHNEATEDSNSEETLSSEAALPFAENKDNFATNQNFMESDTSSNRSTNVSEFGKQLPIPSEIDSEKLHDRAEGGTQASAEDMMESKTDLCSLGQEEEGPSRVSFSGSDGHVVSSPSREYLRDELNALNDAENEARNIDSLNACTSELVVNVSVDDNPTDMDSLFEEENKDHETGMIVI
ncbi:hypothetical protein ACFE04_000890 [Oxalis oulophora]